MSTLKKPLTLTTFSAATVASALFLTGALCGWALNFNDRPVAAEPRSCLRLEGYTYTKPLLACDTLPTGVHSSQMETVKKTVEEEINEAVQRGDVTHVSVYVRDLVNRQEVSINGDEKFFPASLKKVPLMMAYFKAAETSP
ncbi:MAG TPA: serine hydrolase, partial [Verrucomicrobiae bacterium]|nr:serine hydrolase [Verrucomicrobiae bacterium]